MSFNPEHHHRRSIRLQSYDYRQAGAYFVTVCTHGREPHLGNVTQGIMHLSALGECVLRHWYDIPRSFALVELDAFVVMPNHIHGIVVITTETPSGVGRQGAANATLGQILRSFKSRSAIASNRLLERTGQAFWQRNYWEHIIRNDTELQALRQYIVENPMRWQIDKLFVKDMGAQGAASVQGAEGQGAEGQGAASSAPTAMPPSVGALLAAPLSGDGKRDAGAGV